MQSDFFFVLEVVNGFCSRSGVYVRESFGGLGSGGWGQGAGVSGPGAAEGKCREKEAYARRSWGPRSLCHVFRPQSHRYSGPRGSFHPPPSAPPSPPIATACLGVEDEMQKSNNNVGERQDTTTPSNVRCATNTKPRGGSFTKKNTTTLENSVLWASKRISREQTRQSGHGDPH